MDIKKGYKTKRVSQRGPEKVIVDKEELEKIKILYLKSPEPKVRTFLTEYKKTNKLPFPDTDKYIAMYTKGWPKDKFDGTKASIREKMKKEVVKSLNFEGLFNPELYERLKETKGKLDIIALQIIDKACEDIVINANEKPSLLLFNEIKEYIEHVKKELLIDSFTMANFLQLEEMFKQKNSNKELDSELENIINNEQFDEE